MSEHKILPHLSYLSVKQASSADARALASVFVPTFKDDGMSRWVWHRPPKNSEDHAEIIKLAIDERVIGRRPELYDPAIHIFGIYDTSIAVNGKPRLVGQSGWKVYKPASADPDVSPLVTKYSSRIRQTTFFGYLRDRLGWLYDNLLSAMIPKWVYRLWNPKLAAMLERRKRWTLNRAEAYRKAVLPEDIERGYYAVVVLGILPEYERRGIGAMLLRWGLDRADEDDAAVYVSATPAGAKLYTRQGFELVSKRICFSGEKYGGFPAVIMRRKRLSERGA